MSYQRGSGCPFTVCAFQLAPTAAVLSCVKELLVQNAARNEHLMADKFVLPGIFAKYFQFRLSDCGVWPSEKKSEFITIRKKILWHKHDLSSLVMCCPFKDEKERAFTQNVQVVVRLTPVKHGTFASA